ncbi:MAG: sugar nucleotide-binding protein [Clostridia bacterium]|nr:sugar nucleotide-binding protein [Clostridia bacterium]
MRILVIGASSFIGREVYFYAKQQGHCVLGTRYSSKDDELLYFDLFTHDIEDVIPDWFVSVKESLYCIICSAIPKIDKCKMNLELSEMLNVTKTIKTVDSLSRMGFKVVFLSSEAVFDGEKGYYNENDRVNPVNEYGKQKVKVETHILSFYPKHLIFRLSMVVSSKVAKGHLFYDWYNNIEKKLPIKCIRGQIFSPTDVEDVAKGILIALEKDLEGVYHLSNPEFFLRDELARLFILQSRLNVMIDVLDMEKFKFFDKRTLKTYLDGSKFTNRTGFCFNSISNIMHNFWSNTTGKKLIKED